MWLSNLFHDWQPLIYSTEQACFHLKWKKPLICTVKQQIPVCKMKNKVFSQNLYSRIRITWKTLHDIVEENLALRYVLTYPGVKKSIWLARNDLDCENDLDRPVNHRTYFILNRKWIWVVCKSSILCNFRTPFAVSTSNASQAGSCFSSSFSRAIGYILRGFLLGEMKVATVSECKKRCVISAKCLSLNILTNGDGNFMCQLNSDVRENGVKQQFVQHGSGEYYGLEVRPAKTYKRARSFGDGHISLRCWPETFLSKHFF
jgi:hypothetical protein